MYRNHTTRGLPQECLSIDVAVHSVVLYVLGGPHLSWDTVNSTLLGNNIKNAHPRRAYSGLVSCASGDFINVEINR